MTPTPTVLLLVALFWTLPATAAAIAYRKHGYSIENVKASANRVLDRLTPAKPRPEAYRSSE